MRQGQRDRETKTEKERQTETETVRQKDRQNDKDRETKTQTDRDRERDRDRRTARQTESTDPEGVERAEVDRDEGQPDDAGGVHGEADELALVKVLRDLPGLDGVHGADDDEEDVVDEGDEEGEVLAGTLEDDDGLAVVWCVEARAGRLHQKPDGGEQHLDDDQDARHHDLRLGADEGRPLGRAPRALEYPGDAVGLDEQGRVHHREAEAHAEALRRTGHHRGRGQQDEGHDVTDDATGQQHVAELAP